VTAAAADRASVTLRYMHLGRIAVERKAAGHDAEPDEDGSEHETSGSVPWF